ncbi:MAG: hypothetical protein EPO68_15165 [Planctomycetota bacterium]|nr:MAG: hypothetical protein EPO68_15165 [Planctomycetota bacterium]
MLRSRPLHVFLFASTVPPLALHAQGAPFQTPGMPVVAGGDASGQTTRFSSEFNPAISFVLDGLATWEDVDGSDSGLDLELRAGELGLTAWVDPRAWAYGIVVFTEDEVALEEGAVQFTGLGGHRVLRAGRFFVDFGKQMQAHEHELRTIERPAVLRAYLGAELAGDGVQFDDWHALGDATVMRYSVGVFQSLLGESEEEDGVPHAVDAEQKDLDELGYTARLTAFTEVGDAGTLQFGASARALPDYAFELDNGASATGLSSTVWGVDLTYGWVDATNTRRFTTGLEWLFDTGENGADVDDQGTPLDPSDDTLDVHDGTVGGYYAFADYAWSAQRSAGIQHSWLELPEAGEPTLAELDLYYTHGLSEYGRLRVGLTFVDAEDGADGVVAALQYTNVIGAHGHAVNF